jgi:methylated-DNA-protein-cysteine methyltransferase-like protein
VASRKVLRPCATAAQAPAIFRRIWREIAAVPHGQWASYGGIARRVGVPRGARLVAYVIKHAPEELHLPWHRILGAGGCISLPPGSRGAREQQRRLRAEGHLLRGRRIVSSRLGSPEALDALLWKQA